MSASKPDRCRSNRRTAPSGRVAHISDLTSTLLGQRPPTAAEIMSVPAAVTAEDGHVLSRAELTAVLERFAMISYSILQLVPAEHREEALRIWETEAIRTQFETVTASLTERG